MNKKKGSQSLYVRLLIVTVIPLFALGVIITAFSFSTFKAAMNKEVYTELQNISVAVMNTYDLVYPGDYTKVGNEEIVIYKGENLLNGNNEIIDTIKKETDLDITIFYNDMRIVTTLEDKNGQRILGTTAHIKVVKEVLNAQKEHFYNNATVNDIPYFAYYTPLYNSDGSCIGMLFVGKPTSTVNTYVTKSLIPIIIIAILAMIIAGFISVSSTHKIVAVIKAIQRALANVSIGKLDYSVDDNVIDRKDELGDIGKSIVNMQNALKNLVEFDTLTKIHNRRYGEMKLISTMDKSKFNGMEFSVAIAGIDFFKEVNDTYGHDCGDLVLQNIANILKRNMAGKGFVARWGGEEFLIVYDRIKYEEACDSLRRILDQIRIANVEYNGDHVKVTITFGLVRGNCEEKLRIILKKADELLYEGKMNGRNQIVTQHS